MKCIDNDKLIIEKNTNADKTKVICLQPFITSPILPYLALN